jgi:hypothetical protein
MTDDLEIGLAAGLDAPTAIVLSEEDKPPQRGPGRGCAWILLIGSAAVLVLWWLACR